MPTKARILTITGQAPKAVGFKLADSAGIAVQRFEVGLIRLGLFKHPSAGWELPVTAAKLGEWNTAMQKMLASGIRIPLVSSHDTVDAKDTLGRIVDSFVRDGWLFGVAEVTGEDAINTVARNFVSVELMADYTDGEGVNYGEAIRRVAVTATPVVSGQKGFVQIAASLDSSGKRVQAEVLEFATEGSDPAKAEREIMSILTKVQEVLGIETALSEQNLSDVLTKWKNSMLEKIAAAGVTPTGDGNPSALSLALDPDVAAQLHTLHAGQLDDLVRQGKITPDVSKRLAECLLGTAEKPNVVAMSLKGAKAMGCKEPLTKSVIAALSANDPVKLSEQSKRQGSRVDRTVPGDDDTAAFDPKVRDRMLAEANGVEAKHA